MTTFAIAAVAFVGHAPALAVLGYRLRRQVVIANIIAVVATLAAMAIAFAFAGGLGLLVAWLAGHFVWGAILAGTIAANRDGTLHRQSSISR